MKNLIFAVLLLTAAHFAYGDPEIKGTPSELAAYLSNVPGIVTLTGEGEVKSPADRAVITLKVTTDHKSLAEALRANDAIRNRLMALLKEGGVAADRVHASKFSSAPKYSLFSDKVKSQRVEKLVKVTVRDEKEFEVVASAPDKFSEISYISAEFEHSEKEKLKLQAIAEACDDATRQKQLLEQKLALKLVPRRVAEQFPSRYIGPDVVRAQGGASPSTTPLPAYAESPQVQRAVESISPFGELNFKVFINVEYLCKPSPTP